MAQQPAVNQGYYTQPPPNYVEETKPLYPTAPVAPEYPAYQPQMPPQYPTPTSPSAPVTIQPPPQQQPAVTVVTAIQLGEDPVLVQCPFCTQMVTTSVTYSIGGLVWLICGLLTITGFILCACIPCCIRACKDATHTCPNCKKVIGRYKRI